jgi:hypothetical protein
MLSRKRGFVAFSPDSLLSEAYFAKEVVPVSGGDLTLVLTEVGLVRYRVSAATL